VQTYHPFNRYWDSIKREKKISSFIAVFHFGIDTLDFTFCWEDLPNENLVRALLAHEDDKFIFTYGSDLNLNLVLRVNCRISEGRLLAVVLRIVQEMDTDRVLGYLQQLFKSDLKDFKIQQVRYPPSAIDGDIIAPMIPLDIRTKAAVEANPESEVEYSGSE